MAVRTGVEVVSVPLLARCFISGSPFMFFAFKFPISSMTSLGLVNTFVENWPQYEHGICCKHLYNNLRKNHPGVLIRDLFWKVAKATYQQEHERAMNKLKEVDKDASNGCSLTQQLSGLGTCSKVMVRVTQS
ncbi:uncharacterized protein LOC142641051 isoform X3 [Castanea sativa]|uniref:uncharacterized protein LOC142641051 isoform X3 n=1 Tax=Castanea sativa TaxID=21020 RepID=UPI003F64A0DD